MSGCNTGGKMGSNKMGLLLFIIIQAQVSFQTHQGEKWEPLGFCICLTLKLSNSDYDYNSRNTTACTLIEKQNHTCTENSSCLSGN